MAERHDTARNRVGTTVPERRDRSDERPGETTWRSELNPPRSSHYNVKAFAIFNVVLCIVVWLSLSSVVIAAVLDPRAADDFVRVVGDPDDVIMSIPGLVFMHVLMLLGPNALIGIVAFLRRTFSTGEPSRYPDIAVVCAILLASALPLMIAAVNFRYILTVIINLKGTS